MKRNGFTTVSKDMLFLSPQEMIVFAVIKSFRKKEGYSDLTFKQIEEHSKVTNIDRIIPRIKTCFNKIEQVDLGNNRKQNNYYFKQDKNYFFINNKFFEDITKDNYKLKGFVLLLKSICINNTNTCKLSKDEICKKLNISKPTLNKYIKESDDIIEGSNGIEIVNPYFSKSSVSINVFNYQVIKAFCEYKGVNPPTYDDKLMNYISAQCCVDTKVESNAYLPYVLVNRCNNLPSEVNLAYFVKVVRNLDYKNKVINNLITL